MWKNTQCIEITDTFSANKFKTPTVCQITYTVRKQLVNIVEHLAIKVNIDFTLTK